MQRADSWVRAKKAATTLTGGEDRLEEAKDLTATEFRVNLQAAVADVKKLLHKRSMTWEEFNPLWSWDNNRVNISPGDKRSADAGATNKVMEGKFSPLADGAAYDLARHRTPVPPLSPDVHRPIEHVFNRLVHNLYTELFRGQRALDSAELVGQFVVEQFYQIDAASIERDVSKLPQLLEWLAANGGAWPPRELR